MVRGRVFTLFAKVASALVLGAFAFVSSGCHQLYCSFIEGLTGEPVDCSHDDFSELIDIELPPLPPPPELPSTISWESPVVAGQAEEIFATGAGFSDADRPLRYRWDLDADRAYDDHTGVGDAGRFVTVTFDNAGRHEVRAQVFPEAAPERISNAYATIDVDEPPPAPPPQDAPPENPPPGDPPANPPPGNSAPMQPPPPENPLEVAIELQDTFVDERPAVRVEAAVSQDGTPVSGATVNFDFETDGTVDAQATTQTDGAASATHRYEDGTHTVTTTAAHGTDRGSASRTFTYQGGEITTSPAAPSSRAGPAATRRFSARLQLSTVRQGELFRARGRVGRLRELSLGSLSGRVRRGRPGPVAGFLSSTWLTRTNITYDRRRNRVRVSGVALATFRGTPGQACVRYSLSTRPRRRFGRGTMRLLGGSGSASTLRAVARVRVTARRGAFVLSGRLTTSTVPARGLHPSCVALLREVRALPG